MIGTALPADRPDSAGSGNDPLLSSRGRYVVGFDGSQASTMALRWATQRAYAGSHEVVLFGVAGERGDRTAPSELDLARKLGRRADELRHGSAELAVSTRVAKGDVAAVLAQAVSPGDVLVVGSDKTGYAQGRVHGFRSLELAASAIGNLVIVPAVDLRMRSGVVVGVDDTPGALELVRIGAREAANRRSLLLLVHAVPPGGVAPDRGRPDEVLDRARLIAWAEEAGISVTEHLVQRRPADALLNLSRDRALLVIGRSRQPGPLGVGPALHEVLINVNAPTVVVP